MQLCVGLGVFGVSAGVFGSFRSLGQETAWEHPDLDWKGKVPGELGRVLLHHITGPVQPPSQLLPVPWAPDQVTAPSRASFSGLREEQREPAKDHAPSQQVCHGDNKRTTNPSP